MSAKSARVDFLSENRTEISFTLSLPYSLTKHRHNSLNAKVFTFFKNFFQKEIKVLSNSIFENSKSANRSRKTGEGREEYRNNAKCGKCEKIDNIHHPQPCLHKRIWI